MSRTPQALIQIRDPSRTPDHEGGEASSDWTMFDYLHTVLASARTKDHAPLAGLPPACAPRPEDDPGVKLAIWIAVIAVILYIVSSGA